MGIRSILFGSSADADREYRLDRRLAAARPHDIGLCGRALPRLSGMDTWCPCPKSPSRSMVFRHSYWIVFSCFGAGASVRHFAGADCSGWAYIQPAVAGAAGQPVTPGSRLSAALARFALLAAA